jgi:protein phosphatase
MIVACRTLPGRGRRINQDAVFARGVPSSAPRLAVVAVADGVSGTVGGDVASRIAFSAVNDLLTGLTTDDRCAAAVTLIDLPRRIVDSGRQRLQERSTADPGLRHMATTFTVVALRGTDVSFAHLGDSRAYLLRHGRLRKFTTDHTVAEELIASGVLTREAAPFHSGGHILTRWLAPADEVFPDVGTLGAAPGDLLLVCSDGLYRSVDDDVIASVCLSAQASDQKALDALAQALVDTANDNGASDNISVALATVSH